MLPRAAGLAQFFANGACAGKGKCLNERLREVECRELPFEEEELMMILWKFDKMELRATKMAGEFLNGKMNETERNERAKEGSCPGIKNGCCVGRMSIAEE
jgi:hypothetical protein